MGYAPQKFGRGRGAERVEVLSSQACLQCGHVVTDHHRAGGGLHNGQNAQWRGSRDHCIGDRDTCGCRGFVQPHTFTRHSVRMGS